MDHDPKKVSSAYDAPEAPMLVQQQQLVEIGPAIRTETPDGDESEMEMAIRRKHNARRMVRNAARDYENGSIDHEKLDRAISRARYDLED